MPATAPIATLTSAPGAMPDPRPPAAARPGLRAAPGGRVMFVDPGVADAAALLAGAAPGVRAWLLDATGDGLAEMARVLRGCIGLSEVSVIAHATPASLRLGAATLDAATLGRHAASLAAIGAAVADDGVLALYGCRLGDGADGLALVDRIARAAGTTVAAASHLVGGAAGASWALDVLRPAHAAASPVPPLAPATLHGYAHAFSGTAATPPPAGYPFTITDFSAPSTTGSFVTIGNASVSGAALTLTPDLQSQTGLAFYTAALPSQTGVTIRFTYDSSGGNGHAPRPPGGDGLALILLNGDSVQAGGGLGTVQPGSFGGGLGYSDTGASPGITDGFLAVGFDTYGNFAGTLGNQTTGVGAIDSGPGPGPAPDTVVLRGQEGAGGLATGYDYLASAAYAPGIDGQRDVQVTLSQVDATHEQVSVFVRPTGSEADYTQVLSTTVAQALPNQLYFGFGSGTGGYDDLHQISSVSVSLPVALALSTPTVDDVTTGTVNPTVLNPGDSFNYTYTVTNSGPNGDPDITVSDPLPAGIIGAGYTVTDSAGTHSGTGGAIPVNLAVGATATIVVSGIVDPNATAGDDSHAITLLPGTAYMPTNPNASATVSLPIGPAAPPVVVAPPGAGQVVANDTPTVGGGTANQPVSGTAAVAALAGVTVADPDNTSLAATVTIVGGTANGGRFTPASAAGWVATTVGPDLVYTRTFPAQANIGAAAQAGIDSLVFQPGPVAAGTSVTTHFAIAVTDGTGLVSNTDTIPSVIATAPAAGGGLLPFLPLVASGSAAGQIVTVTAALRQQVAGTYTNLGTGFLGADGRTYVVSGTDAQVTAALHTVTLTPTDPTITSLPEDFTSMLIGAPTGTQLTDTGPGRSVLIAGAGMDTVVSGVGLDTLYGGPSGTMLNGGGGNDLFVSGTGSTTIFAGTGNALAYGNTGTLAFVNSGGAATVFGGAGFAGAFGGTGSLHVYGAGGGGLFYGGTAGGNVMVAGNGPTSILGGGDGDQLYTNSLAQDVLAAGQGNETLSGTGSGGPDLYFGGTGRALIAAGSGSSLITTGAGQDSVFTGATGSATVYGGSGSLQLVEGSGTAIFSAGSGSATVFSGAGADRVSIVNGHAGGTVTLDDFKVGTDVVGLFGYAPGQLAQVIGGAVTAGSTTTLTLSDNTRIVFSGFTAAQISGSVSSST